MLGYRSGFVIIKDGYVVTNFHIMDRANDMKLGLEEWRVFKVEFILNVTDYITGKRTPLSSN